MLLPQQSIALANVSATDGSSSTGIGAELIGFVSLFVACFALAFQFAPLRKCDSKDGFFVQWVQCSVVFMCGFIINFMRGMPPFHPIAVIGGFLYATGINFGLTILAKIFYSLGNIGSVPITSEMGMGMGMLIWGSIQIIVGWCVAHFGLFGTKQQIVGLPALNYIGVVLTLISGVIFVFAYTKSEKSQAKRNTTLPLPSEPCSLRKKYSITKQPKVAPDDFSKIARKLFFIGFAVFLGCFHGLMMTPIVYIQDNYPNHSENVLDYMFTHFSSVFFFSSLYFIIYSLVKRGEPFIEVKLVIPSLAYGILFSVGMTLLFVANHLLSQTVAYPIAVRLPAIISAIAEIFIFKRITNFFQQFLMFAAISIGVAGVVLIGLSL